MRIVVAPVGVTSNERFSFTSPDGISRTALRPTGVPTEDAHAGPAAGTQSKEHCARHDQTQLRVVPRWASCRRPNITRVTSFFQVAGAQRGAAREWKRGETSTRLHGARSPRRTSPAATSLYRGYHNHQIECAGGSGRSIGSLPHANPETATANTSAVIMRMVLRSSAAGGHKAGPDTGLR